MTIWAPFERYGDSVFKDSSGGVYEMDALGMDQFYMNILGDDVVLYEKHIDCVECDYRIIKGLKIGNTHTIYQTQFKNEITCNFEGKFGEFGVYNVFGNSSNCTVDEIREHVNIYFPILSATVIYTLLSLAIYALTRVCPKLFTDDEDDGGKKKRMKSLDTFRGLTILMMIFANFGGGGYYYIEHAPWNGLHIADVIFPWFMWIMGAVIPITLPSKLKQTSKKEIFYDVFLRSLKLFCLGIFLGGGSNLYGLRIMGVLQRFGIAYLVVTTILMFTLETDNERYNQGLLSQVKDVLVLWKGWLVAFIILIIHLLVVFLVHAIDCPAGYLGPGGDHESGKYFGCVGGATGYIDRSILGSMHVYQNPTIKDVFGTKTPFDPEGLVGCLTTIFHVFIGVQAGSIYVQYKNEANGHFKIMLRWLLWSLGTGLIAGLLCGFSKEGGVIPVNKNLWSLSFVLVTSCFAFLVLTVFYFLIDYKTWWTGKPLFFAGMNAIVLYAGHEMTDGHLPVRFNYIDDSLYSMRQTHFGSLMSDTWGAAVWLFISYIMFRKKVFVTL